MQKVRSVRNREVSKASSYRGLPLSRTRKGSKGFDISLLARMELWLDHVVSKYSKSHFVRIDLTFPDRIKNGKIYSDDNVLISEFLDTFKRWYSRNKIRIDYFWVRERSKTGNQHYHLMLVLDGNRVKSSWPVVQRANDVWTRKLDLESGKGLVHSSRLEVDKIERRFIEVENCNPYRYERLFEALSYMAKVYQKDTPKGLNEFGHSRIPKLREARLPDLFPELVGQGRVEDASMIDYWP